MSWFFQGTSGVTKVFDSAALWRNYVAGENGAGCGLTEDNVELHGVFDVNTEDDVCVTSEVVWFKVDEFGPVIP